LKTVAGILASTIVHAAGHGVPALWDATRRGESALRRNPLSWSNLSCWLGEVPGVDDVQLPADLQSWNSRNNRLAWLALQDASFRDAAVTALGQYGAERVGLVLGTSTSGIRDTEIAYEARRATGAWPDSFDYRKVHSLEATARFSAEVLGVRGPITVVSTACSSSAKAFLVARRWIDAGWIDAAVVGGVDSLCLSTLHGFDSLQLLSADACRPFDANRNGISIGEAAGFVLIARDAAPIVLSGGGESSDAWHMSAPHPQGEGAQAAMHAALEQAGLQAGDIGYVNAHGTATPVNDRAEAAAVRSVFGAHGVPVSSTKGVTGHTLGATGIVEAIVTMQALAHQLLPPSANCETPDPAFEIDLVMQARTSPLRHAMSNNFGFGGSNCTLIFSRAD
jgi:3-oxoacyl-[acyl-carrier-protein] synthase-1